LTIWKENPFGPFHWFIPMSTKLRLKVTDVGESEILRPVRS